MNISYGVAILAPQTTGHPAALPPDVPLQPSDTLVADISDTADGMSSGQKSGGDEITAPPTAIQRKIMEILEQQAEALDTN